MANSDVQNVFPEVPLIQVGEKVKGGEDGAINKPIKALITRTDQLKQEIDSLIKKGINLIGTLATQADLDVVETGTLSKGDGYFVQGALNIWNGTEWVSSGSLIGPPGEALNEVSEDPNNALSFGEDGKLYVTTDISSDLLEIYTQAKE